MFWEIIVIIKYYVFILYWFSHVITSWSFELSRPSFILSDHEVELEMEMRLEWLKKNVKHKKKHVKNVL